MANPLSPADAANNLDGKHAQAPNADAQTPAALLKDAGAGVPERKVETPDTGTTLPERFRDAAGIDRIPNAGTVNGTARKVEDDATFGGPVRVRSQDSMVTPDGATVNGRLYTVRGQEFFAQTEGENRRIYTVNRSETGVPTLEVKPPRNSRDAAANPDLAQPKGEQPVVKPELPAPLRTELQLRAEQNAGVLTGTGDQIQARQAPELAQLRAAAEAQAKAQGIALSPEIKPAQLGQNPGGDVKPILAENKPTPALPAADTRLPSVDRVVPARPDAALNLAHKLPGDGLLPGIKDGLKTDATTAKIDVTGRILDPTGRPETLVQKIEGLASPLAAAQRAEADKHAPTVRVEPVMVLGDKVDSTLTTKIELDPDKKATDTAGSAAKFDDLIEKAKKQREEEKLDEEDQLNSRNAMMMALLAQKKQKQEQEEKEFQLRNDDPKKKDDDKRRRYVVKEKETLESIAKKQLRDVRLAALIYEINKHMLPVRMEKGKQVVDPRPGTAIWLPTETQIKEFRMRLYAASNSDAGAGAPGAKFASVDDELAAKFGAGWEGNKPGISAADGMMGSAVAKSQTRRENIEKILGPMSEKPSDSARIRYIVRLTDSIESVAQKHPALKDASLWPLVASVNHLPTGLDQFGRPLAELRRGMVLDIPLPYEIERFKLEGDGEQDDSDIDENDDDDENDFDEDSADVANENVIKDLGVETADSAPALPSDFESTVRIKASHPLIASPGFAQAAQSAPAPAQNVIPQSANLAANIAAQAISQAPLAVPGPIHAPTAASVSTPVPEPTPPAAPKPAFPFAASANAAAASSSSAATSPLPVPAPLPGVANSEQSVTSSATSSAAPTAIPTAKPITSPITSPTPTPSSATLATPIAHQAAPVTQPLPHPSVQPSQPVSQQQQPAPSAHQSVQQPSLQHPSLQQQQSLRQQQQSMQQHTVVTQPIAPRAVSPQPAPTLSAQGNSNASVPAQGQPFPQFTPQPSSQTDTNPVLSAVPVISQVQQATGALPTQMRTALDQPPIDAGDRFIWQLDPSVRLVKSTIKWEPSVGVFRSQLELLLDEIWYPVIFYEVFPQMAVRHEYIGGGRKKSVKMDLPPTPAQELADNDLVNNWQRYCHTFVAQMNGPKTGPST